MCTHLLFFLFFVSFSCLSFRKIAQIFCNTFFFLELRYTLWDVSLSDKALLLLLLLLIKHCFELH
jgi:hypothetical protein